MFVELGRASRRRIEKLIMTPQAARKHRYGLAAVTGHQEKRIDIAFPPLALKPNAAPPQSVVLRDRVQRG